jgi:hypothetical protein
LKVLKTIQLFPLLFSCCIAAFGQGQVGVLDSISHPGGMDSLQSNLARIESIRNDFNNHADSLRGQYEQAIALIDAPSNILKSRLDSLQRLSLPTNHVTRQLDSLNQKRKAIEAKFNAQADKLKEKTIGQLKKIEMTDGVASQLQPYTSRIEGFNLTADEYVELPPMEIPGMGDLNISDLTSSVKDLTALPDVDLPGDVNLDQVSDVAGEVTSVTDAGAVTKLAEQQVSGMDGFSQLQKGSSAIDGYKSKLAIGSDSAAMANMATELVRKEAVNHFAGHEEVLEKAMATLSKYQKKYHTVASIKDIKDKPLANGLKGMPFLDRFIPGIMFQIQTKDYWLFDLNPYVSYRISGRFIGGLGWNERWGYDPHTNEVLRGNTRIYGPRAFVDTKIGKGFHAHVETETMSTFVPIDGAVTGEGQREWVWSLHVGMKKTYTIYRNLSGTILLQYNFLNEYFKTPYVDRLNARMGFEYTLKKKQQAADKQ